MSLAAENGLQLTYIILVGFSCVSCLVMLVPIPALGGSVTIVSNSLFLFSALVRKEVSFEFTT